MEYISLILGLLSFFFIGYTPVYFLLTGRGGFKVGSRSVSGRFFIFFTSFFTGALMTGWLLTIFSLFDATFDNEIIYGVSTAFFIFYIYNYLSIRFRSRERKSMIRLDRDMVSAWESSRTKKKKVLDKRKETGPGTESSTEDRGKAGGRAYRITFIIITVLIVLNFFIVVFFTVIFPIRFWDAISCWSLKGKAFFIDGIINNFYTAHNYGFSHPSYPLYLPLMQTWLLSWMGTINENFLKIIFPIFYSSFLISLYYLFRQKLDKLVSIIFVFIVSVLPIIADHGYIEYTNLLFSIAMLLAVYFFYLATVMNGKVTYYIMSAVFFSVAALTRSEGILYVFCFIVLSLILFTYRAIKGNSLRSNLLSLLMPLAVFIIFLTPWYLLKAKLGLPAISAEWTQLFSGSTGLAMAPDFKRAASALGLQLVLSIYDSTRAILGSFYGPIWILLMVAMLFGLKGYFTKSRWVFFIFIIFGLGTVFISLALIPDFVNSTERYILHLFPLAYYWVMTGSIGEDLQERIGIYR